MVFVALKPCRFGGTDYLIGDSIPREKVLPEQVERLRDMGIISIKNAMVDTLHPAEDDNQPKRRDKKKAE